MIVPEFMQIGGKRRNKNQQQQQGGRKHKATKKGRKSLFIVQMVSFKQ